MSAARVRKEEPADLSHLQSVPKQEEVATQFKLATANQRVLAYILDMLVVGMATAAMMKVLTVMGGKANGLTGMVLNQLPMILYFFLMQFYDGQTVGKKVMKIKVISADGSSDLNAGALLMRETVGRIVDMLGLAIGYYGAVKRPDRKTWHDQMAKTVVIAYPKSRASADDVNTAWMLKACYAVLLLAIVGGFMAGLLAVKGK